MVSENDRSEYVPVEGEDALIVEHFDVKALDFIIDYLRGRAGMEPFLRGEEKLVMLPSREVMAEDSRMINLVLDAVRDHCKELAWRATSNTRLDGDVAVESDLLAVVADVGLTAALARLPQVLEPMNESNVVADFPPELLVLERGKFCVLDDESLVVNVEGFGDRACENFINEILNLEIPDAEGGVNMRGAFICPVKAGKYLRFELSNGVCVDADLLAKIELLIGSELFLFDAWDHAVV